MAQSSQPTQVRHLGGFPRGKFGIRIIFPVLSGVVPKERAESEGFRRSSHVQHILAEAFQVLGEIRAQVARQLRRDAHPFLLQGIEQQFPLMAQAPQTSAARRAFGAVRLSISLWYRCFCRHRGSLVSWKKTWGRARGALTPRRGHLVRDWRGKCTGKRESRGIDRKDGGGTLQAVEQGFEQLTHRLQGVGVKQRAHALP